MLIPNSLQPTDRAIQAVVNTKLAIIFENMNVPPAVIGPSELEDVTFVFSAHDPSKTNIQVWKFKGGLSLCHCVLCS